MLRAGEFKSERSCDHHSGINFTETDGGSLNCRFIIFTDWKPPSATYGIDDLRKSIKIFISGIIDILSLKKNIVSAAIAVTDLCADVALFAEEMISEAKSQLISRKSNLKLSFILQPSQKELLVDFFNVFAEIQNVFAYLYCPITSSIVQCQIFMNLSVFYF